MLKKSLQLFFYGNYFYGICAVTLNIETALQLGVSLNSFLYYLFIFSATVFYYTLAFPGEVKPGNHANKRTRWYADNRQLVRYSKVITAGISTVCGLYILLRYYTVIKDFALWQWLIILLIVLAAFCYYGFTPANGKQISLRSTGWLKPFVIGFVWAGLVTVAPIFLHHYTNSDAYNPLLLFWFFVKNWMYITVLGIMFDIKDYATDYNKQLKTFVVRVGLRKTIFYIIIPLAVIGLASYIAFVMFLQFPLTRIVFNSIPFVLLIIVAWSLHRRKPILYYLAIIDGLMFIKALCGIAGVMLSN